MRGLGKPAPFFLLALAPLPLQAQGVAADITVVGLGERGYRLTPEILRSAVSSFEQARMEFAPAARLTWQLATPHPTVKLALTGAAGETLPIAVGADDSFTLPHDKILTGPWRLVSPEPLRIRPFALSPGGTLAQFRFGDARLSCQLLWGLLSAQSSIMARATLNKAGGCASPRISIYFNSAKPIATISISHAAKAPEIAPDGLSWRVPLGDKAIANDDLVTITYRPAR